VTVTSAAGSAPTVNVATAEGGQLRSQDIRTTSDAVGLGGSLIRINPDTGAPSVGNPITSGSANAKRIVAHGYRNPFRLTFRPGTTDLYLGLVGNQTWEAINRIAVPSSATPTTLPNAGWPCYEGPEKPASFSGLGTNMCASLYAAGSAAWKAPFYSYSHTTTRSPTGPCFNPVDGKDGGSPTGLAFYQGPAAGTASYPAKYVGGLFFVDFDRDCLAFFPKTASGVPDATQMQQVASGIANPVDLLAGPGGNLFYVDHNGGRVVRIRYVIAPVARATATPEAGRAPLTIQLSGTTSSDPDPAASLVAYRWDLDDDGQYDDATGATYNWSITTPDVYPVGLEVESSNGLKDTASITVDATNAAPVPEIDAPNASLTWAVGDEIQVDGSATDAEDGDLTGTALRWDVVMLHCPADCHEHLVESFTGETGTFDAPDHPYPSHLELRLTATDTHGTRRTASVEIEPTTKTVSIASSPTGVPVSLGGDPVTSPSTTTVLENGEVTVTPPLAPTIGGTRHRFWAWADATARIRNLTVADDISLTATYLPDRADTCASAPASASRTWLTERPNGNDDVDWFRFSLGAARDVLVTLGDLPVDARLDLYSSCSTRLAGSDADGTRFEEITRRLGEGTYRVKVSFPGGGRSQTPYVLRFQPLLDGMVVKSSRTTSGPTGGAVRIVGEVLNNTGATRGRPTVTATFRSAGGSVVGTLSTRAFARRIGDGGVTPFVLAGTVPTYASVSFAVAAGSPPSSRPLGLTSLTRTTNGDGTITEKGTVRNTGSVTARDVAAARTWYGRRGEVLDRGSAFVSPSTLAPGASGTFTILRPVLANVQATRTALRAS
jgi:PKD repeat protein